jgi:hypothetical protein
MAAVIDGVPVAIPPPEGYKVDFNNPQRNSVTEAYWLFGVGNFLSLLFVLQRVYVKGFLQRSFRIEDGQSRTRQPFLRVLTDAFVACLGVAYVFLPLRIPCR